LAPTELFTLGADGNSLRVTVEAADRSFEPLGEPVFESRFEVEAYPFAGTLVDTLLLDDLVRWRDGLVRLEPPGLVTLGGDRSAELQLHVEPAVGVGTEGQWVSEVRLARSGEAPWPEIRYLIWDEPFTERALEAVGGLLAARVVRR